MKRTDCIILLSSLFLFACNPKTDQGSVAFDPDADYIQIVLFHLEKRCASCNAVEQETVSILENYFREESMTGEIRMISLDFQDSEGKKAAALLRASGQTLFVVSSDSVADLTSEAFMFALTHPERYRAALVEVLEKMLD